LVKRLRELKVIRYENAAAKGEIDIQLLLAQIKSVTKARVSCSVFKTGRVCICMLKKDEAEFDKVQKIYLEMKGGADPMQQPQQMMLEP